MSTRNRMALIGLVITMAACGGSASDAIIGDFSGLGGPPPPQTPPPPVSTNAGGVWEGSTFNDQAGLTFEAIGIVTENNVEARFVND